MRVIVLNYPIGFQISGELEGSAVLVELAFRCLSFFSEFFNFIIADWTTSGVNQSGIDGNAFINA